MVIIDSIRESASRGLLARSVPIEPSWPVFMACKRAYASRLHTSPTMIRPARMRRQFLTRSRMVIWPSPSRLGGRVSSLTVCGCWSWSSVASSAGDDALVVIDELGQAVEQCGLAGAGSARDQGVDAAAADHLENLRTFRRNAVESDQLIEGQLLFLELADGERGAVDRERRDNHVDAGVVGQARVTDRRGLVVAAADLADDALANVQKLLVIAESDAGLLDLAPDFDVSGA